MRVCIFRLIACILLSGYAGLSAVTALAQEELFNYRQLRSPMPLDTGPATVAEYEAVVNVSALVQSERDTVELQLPDGSRFVAVQEEIEYREKNSFVWRGKLKGDNGDGHGVITVHQGYIAGRLLFPGRDVIELKPGPEPGVVRILELDSSLFPENEEDVLIPETGLEPQKSSLQLAPSSATPTNTRGGGPIIDVMVVYTPMARQQAGGTAQIEAQIQAAVDVTNDAYANSDVLQRIALVHVQEVAYDGDQNGETSSQQLTWVYSESPTVTALREQYQADLVALISEQIPDLGGVALVMNYPHPFFELYGFSVTERSNAVGNLTFAHELGHNMGLHHDPDNGPTPEERYYPWSIGHYFQTSNGNYRRTIMAYSDPCPGTCPRIPYFSNPNVLYLGGTTGIANERDNALTLNLTADVVTKFRDEDWLFGSRFTLAWPITASSDCLRVGWSGGYMVSSMSVGVQGSTNRRYGGPCGLRVPVSNAAYLVSDHPENETSYNVRFYVFLDDATGDIRLFDTLDGSNNEAFSVWFHDGDVTLRVASASGEKTATFSNIESGWHSIHVSWESAATANVEFLVANRNTANGSEQVISGNTSTMTISRARLGSVDGTSGGGSLDFDAFVSTRTTPPERLLVGDAEPDEEINSGDLVATLDEIYETAFAKGQPDCDENGSIDSGDLVCMNDIIFQ